MTVTASQPHSSARSAKTFQPVASPAVLNIVSYRFGADPQATRPDRIMRSPTAALLIQRRGRLYQWADSMHRVAMPGIALLGPSNGGRIWETDPDTEFTLVNLAPGAAGALFGMDPRDLEDQIEPLMGHRLIDRLYESLFGGQESLHRCLCELVRRNSESWDLDRRVRQAFDALLGRALGDRARAYADALGVTPRTLQRVVRRGVGLTPKRVLGIERVRNLVTLTAGGWSGTLAELAQAGSFYDQSHLRQELENYGLEGAEELARGDHIIVRQRS